MKLPRRNFLHLAVGAAALPVVSRNAWAQAYPTRPVRIIVGFPAGSGVDIVARLVGQWLAERVGQPFIIENRPGAGGNIATEAVVRADFSRASCGFTRTLQNLTFGPRCVGIGESSLDDVLKRLAERPAEPQLIEP
jgi:tripartite-type tricarboxylate transporter receptor subunit TctC